MKFSVVIPTKNNPEQVRRCIDSIPTSSDIEILLCDDYSESVYLEKIKSLCDEKINARVICSDVAAGAGHARNMGIDNSEGEWLIFSDSDDFFDTDFWAEIDRLSEDSTADIIYFKVKGVFSDSLAPAKRGATYNKYVEDFLNNKKNAEERLRFYHMVPWGKVFRKSFIINCGIRYDEVRASNDVMFNVKAGSQARFIEAHKSLMYYVTVSNNSLTKNKSKEVLHCRFQVYMNHYKYVTGLGKPQCVYNLFKFAWQYSKPYGIKEFFWYYGQIIKNRVNPFVIVAKINRYE